MIVGILRILKERSVSLDTRYPIFARKQTQNALTAIILVNLERNQVLANALQKILNVITITNKIYLIQESVSLLMKNLLNLNKNLLNNAQISTMFPKDSGKSYGRDLKCVFQLNFNLFQKTP